MRHFRRLFVPFVLLLFFGFLVVPKAVAAEREVLYDKESTYPRIVRLQHNGLANGRLLTSLQTWSGKDGIAVISESTDGGRSFHQLSTIRDPDAANGRGICCGAFYELPRAVGGLAEGTLLFADTTGFTAPEDQRRTKLRLWASTDRGRNWSFVSDIATAANRFEIWEPDLRVAADGALVVLYSDETDKHRHDQKIVQTRSYDAKRWTDRRDTVVNDDQRVRPGMPSSLRLPDGRYLLAYEQCNLDPAHLCSIFTRTSEDGWNYGDPRAVGTVVRTSDGKYARHTPTISWSPGPGPNGTVLLMSEILVLENGQYAPGNGNTVLGNDAFGSGDWYEMPAPAPVQNPDNTRCKNFSPSIAAAPEGKTAVEITTDLDGKVCKTYYGKGPLVRR